MMKRLLTYQDCIERYGSDYFLKDALTSGKLFKIEKGVYATEPYVPELGVVTMKYPGAVYTMDSAFYYHGLTNEAPDLYHLATKRAATRIKDPRVKQYFVKPELFDIGIVTKDVEGSIIRIYDLERMLIELVRGHKHLPYDYYKEIIRNYRKEADTMDFAKLYEYAGKFSLGDTIMEVVEREVV